MAVAEILLQKTRGEDAERVWVRVIETYPTACKLANASPYAVEGLIAPLGLRRQRTHRLQSMAQALCAGAGIAEKVSGLGPYGSAITAMSCGLEPHNPPVDGNIARIITRLHGLTFDRGEPRKKPAVKRAVEAIMASQPRAERKLEAVYALVDLGAAVCTPHHPSCGACPLAEMCASAATQSG